MSASISKLIAAWQIDFYAGWSFMDIFSLGVVLTVVSSIISYFYQKMGRA